MKPTTLLFCFLSAAPALYAEEPLPRGSDWQVAGRLGLLQFVVVSESKAKDRDFYDALIKTLCDPGGTCFLRFFTNSKKVPVKMPLPDAVLAEPTAMFQRSAKQGNAAFQWSCRMGLAAGNCF